VHVAIRRAYLGIVAGAGAVVSLISIVELVRHPVGSQWFVLVGLTLVTGWSTLRLRGVPVGVSISDTFLIAAALLFGPAAGVVIVLIDVLVMSLRVSDRTRADWWIRVAFSVAAATFPMWLAAHLFFAITQTGPLATQPGQVREVIGALAAFAAVYFVLNTGFVAVAVAGERGTSVATVWREHFSALWLTSFSGASIAGVLILLNAARIVDVTTITLVLPLLVILHFAYKGALERAQEQVEHFATVASYEAALRSTADAVVVTGRNGAVMLINPAAEQLTGWTEREAAGRPVGHVFQVLDPATRVSISDGGAPAFDARRLSEYILVRRDGVECPIEHTESRVRDQAGDTIGTIKTFRDISVRKGAESEREALLESERRARATADAANRLKDEFLTTLSHELRTPATGILGWIRLLKTGRMDDAQNRQALDALDRSAKAQAVLLDDLLDMSRIVRGTLRLELRPTDLRDVLKDAMETVQPAIMSKSIDCHIQMPPNLPLVQADPDRLRQVLWNLLSNAVKFTERGGSIDVAVVAEAGHVGVDIIDNGRGIDPEALPFIFDRFRQADGSTTRSHGGLGIGLAIVRHLMESHGGTVSAVSEGHGRGSRFTIRLPALVSAPETGHLHAAS
jgi:PAS domain S-box-containing protein